MTNKRTTCFSLHLRKDLEDIMDVENTFIRESIGKMMAARGAGKAKL